MLWQSSEYILGSKYDMILNMAEYVWIEREYVWIYDNRQDSEYAS